MIIHTEIIAQNIGFTGIGFSGNVTSDNDRDINQTADLSISPGIQVRKVAIQSSFHKF